MAVTPCVGVWIETCINWSPTYFRKVTPCVGVWIETWFVGMGNNLFFKSHPAWVCGLKLVSIGPLHISAKSHPAWVCGLKLGL